MSCIHSCFPVLCGFTDRHECKWGWKGGAEAGGRANRASEVCISDSKTPWLEFCHATIYKLKWIRSSVPWPPLKTLHCWWGMIASAIDWRSISMANPVSLGGGHPKQFRHIERLIRPTELPLGPTQGIKVWGMTEPLPAALWGSVSNLNANGFFKSLAAL